MTFAKKSNKLEFATIYGLHDDPGQADAGGDGCETILENCRVHKSKHIISCTNK